MHDPLDILVYDAPAPCPYLADQVARLPLRHPLVKLGGAELDRRFSLGDRRNGPFLYRTACPSCHACLPIRVPVNEFRPNRSQRRARRRADSVVSVRVGQPVADQIRVDLYNKHGKLRGLNTQLESISLEQYDEFLVTTCCDTLEIDYRIDDVLVAVAIVDRGATSLSAVYCYFDPDFAHLSLGVYSILTQIRLARQWGMDHLYLGLYIAQSPHMNYKTRYRPCEMLIDGRWTVAT